MNLKEIKKKLNIIGYKSPYITSVELGCPEDYCDFIKDYSGQELASSFRLYAYPIHAEDIYGRPIKELEGMLVFGSDIGEYTYAFDTNNNWEVVDIDASGEIFERYGDFETFINTILDEIIESYEEDKEN